MFYRILKILKYMSFNRKITVTVYLCSLLYTQNCLLHLVQCRSLNVCRTQPTSYWTYPTTLNIIIKPLGSAISLASVDPLGLNQLARPLLSQMTNKSVCLRTVNWPHTQIYRACAKDAESHD